MTNTKYKVKACAFRIPFGYTDISFYFNLKIPGFFSQGFRSPLNIPFFISNPIYFPWVTHNFLMLVEEQEGKEEPVAAFHGLATRFTTGKDGHVKRKRLDIGVLNDVLQVYCIRHPFFLADKSGHLKLEVFNQPYDIPSWYTATPYWNTDDHDEAIEWNFWLPADESITVYGEKPEEDDALRLWDRLRNVRTDWNKLKIHYSACGLGRGLGFINCINSNAAYSDALRLLELPIHHFGKNLWQPGIGSRMIPEKVLEETLMRLKAQEQSIRKAPSSLSEQAPRR